MNAKPPENMIEVLNRPTPSNAEEETPSPAPHAFPGENKVPKRFMIGTCYSVCDPDLSWKHPLGKAPLAL